jgi:KUP system potassium uptake protein
LGIVYGDIGTSPLYALRECFHGAHGIALSHANVLGVLSLIIWSLIVVISIKYLAFVLKADNKGEGGSLALMSLAIPMGTSSGKRSVRILLALGLFGAALLYGDGVITPAISVLSAVEGLKVATPLFEPYILLIAASILIGLFLIQSHGTARIGKTFGPVILVWFTVLGALGLKGILAHPGVLVAFNPMYAAHFLIANSWHGFVVLGSVFLVVTGGEALYADLGHFGRRPIQLGWLFVALPGLTLQYLGQGALLLTNPAAAENPFYLLAPSWGVLPLVGLATAASIIASQALITGAFSLSQQAVQLGYLPRLEIKHTSAKEIGQIYVPVINWALLVGTLYLIFEFKTSSSLAAAYGIAVTATMAVTTVFLYIVMRRRWGWSRLVAVPLVSTFLAFDVAFLSANVMKILDGGWFPLVLGGVLYILMTTWKDGRRILADRMTSSSIPLERFIDELIPAAHSRIPGTAVFMTAVSKGTPPSLVHNLKHNQVIHATVVILTIQTDLSPHVAAEERLQVIHCGAGIHRVIARYGFMEAPNVPEILKQCASFSLQMDVSKTTFFLGRETLIATDRPGMAIWREHLFARLMRNSQKATDYFQIPAEQAIEIGAVVEI